MSNVPVTSGETLSGGAVSSGNIETIESGGTIVDFMISAGGLDLVESGGSATSTTLSAGGLELVESGGVATSTMVDSGGVEVVAPGGSATIYSSAAGAIVASTGVVVISAGSATAYPSTVSNITLDSPGEYEIVLPGGSATSTSVSAGAEELVFSGGAVSGTVISGGLEYIESGGSATSTTVNDGRQYVESGGVASGTTVNYGGFEYIESGGSATSTTVNFGREYVESGGVAIGTTVNSYGFQVISLGGTASGTILSGGGQEDDYGSAISTTVNSGGTEYVESGGVATSTTVNSYGFQVVSRGGTASGTILSGGGEEDDYGSAISTTVNSGGTEYVESGGVATSTTVNSYGSQVISLGGTASGTILSGGEEDDYGSAIGTTVNSGGLEQVALGGAASGTIVYAGEEDDYGSAIGTTVNSGGVEVVESGGVASGTTVNSGGVEVVLPGGVATSTTVNGGIEIVAPGGSANYTSETGAIIISSGVVVISAGTVTTATSVSDITLNSAGEYELVLSGGSATSTTVSNGAEELVAAGGAVSGTAVGSGGVENLDSGSATGTTVNSGGTEYVESGGVATSTTVNSSGEQFILSGGSATGTILSGGTEQDFGSTTSTIVDSGGVELIYSSGVATSTTVNSGGLELIYSGGSASGTTVESGGIEVVAPGGSDPGIHVSSGAIVASTGVVVISAGLATSHTSVTGITLNSAGEYEIVLPGGSATDTSVSSGAEELVFAGGAVSGTTVGSGGVENLDGGSVTSTTVNSGGYQNIGPGGVAIGTTVSSDGTQVISFGGTASGTILSGGTEYDYGSAIGTTVNSGGVELVENGGVAIGTIVNSSGMEVISLGGVATSTIVSGALSEEDDSGSAISTTVSSGGTELVENGGSATSTTIDSSGTQVVSAGGNATGTIVSGGLLDVAGGSATSVTIDSGGSAEVNSGGLLSIPGNPTVATSASLEVDQNGTGGSTLHVSGQLGNNGHVVIGSAGETPSSATFGSIDNDATGGIDIDNAAVTVSSFVYNFGATSGIGVASSAGQTGGSLTVSGTLDNYGALGIGNADITGSATVTVDALSNFYNSATVGEIDITGGTSKEALLHVLSAAPAVWSGGVSLQNDAVLEFSSGSIGAIAGTIAISGGSAFVENSSAPGSDSALSGLTTISGGGELDLEDGAAAVVNGTLANSGKLGLDYYDQGGSASDLTVSGELINSGGGNDAGVAVVGSSILTVGGGIINAGNLFGTGEIDANVTNSGTVLGGIKVVSSPSTPGTLTISGTYTQAASGVLDEVVSSVTINTVSASELVVNGGAADLAGGTLDVTNYGVPLTLGDSLVVLSAASGVSGTFGAIEYDGITSAGQIVDISSGLAAQIEYNDSAGTVTLKVVSAGVTEDWFGPSPENNSGAWTNSSNWSLDRVPEAADSVVISVGNAVVSNNVGSIESLSTGPWNGTQAGYLVLSDGGQLTVSDNAVNSGGINIDAQSGQSGSDFTVLGTLTNAGHLTTHTGIGIGNSFSDGSTHVTLGNFINTASGGIDINNATVTVTGNVINSGNNLSAYEGMGVGYFASNADSLDPGVADVGGTLNVGGTFTNDGLLGIGNVLLTQLATVSANTLVNAAGAKIALTGGTTSGAAGFARLDVISGGSNAGTIDVADRSGLELGGTFTNTGTIALDGVSATAKLYVADTGLTLSGGGEVTLVGNSEIVAGPDATAKATIGGSVTANDTITLTLSNTALSLDEPVTYTVTSAAVSAYTSVGSAAGLADIAEGLASAIDSDPALAALGIVAVVKDDTLIIAEPGTVASLTAVSATVTGTETVTFANSTTSGTLSGGGDPTFTNFNTIVGAGTIGDPFMTLVNYGTIDANTTSALVLSGAITNSGTLESTSTGGLDIDGTVTNADRIEAIGTSATVLLDGSTVTNTSAGLILASGTGANVRLDSATIESGTLETSGTGAVFETVSASSDTISGVTIASSALVEATSGTTLTLNGGTIDAGAIVEALASATLDVAGAVANSSTIRAAGAAATVELNGATIADTASGVILASGTGASVQLNGATIVGGKLETSAGGVIETLSGTTNTISGATIVSGAAIDIVSSSTLTLSALAGDGGDFFGNSGTIRGNLDTSGTLEAGSGTTSSTATPSLLTIDGNYAASGGKLIEAVSGASGGTLDVTGTGTADLAGGTLDVVVNSSGGALMVGSSYTVLSATSGITAPFSAIEYNGVTSAGQIIDIGSGGLALQAVYSGNEVTVNVVNSGEIDIWSGGSDDWVTPPNGWSHRTPGIGADTADTAVISAGGDVSVSGVDGNLTVGSLSISSGASLALVSGGQLAVSDNVTNGGTLSVDGTGRGGSTLTVYGTLTNSHDFTIGNSGLSSSTSVTLNGLDNTGTIDIFGNSGGINSATLFVSGAGTNAGQIVVSGDDYDATLELGSSFANSKTIALSGGELLIDGAVSLTGGGNVTLSEDSLLGAAGGANVTLTNVNNKIAGSGVIGAANLTFVNSGTVDANTVSGLILDSGSVANFGTLESTSTGYLTIFSNVNNSKTIEALGTSAQVFLNNDTVTNARSAVILASGSGAFVDLEGATILGGKLETVSGAVIGTLGGSTNTISGVTITSGSTFEVVDGGVLALSGTIANSGTIEVTSSGLPAVLAVSGAATLTGGGEVTLSARSDLSDAGIFDVATTSVTIGGSGTLNDVVSLTFANPDTHAQVSVSFMVSSTGESAADIASNLASKIDSNVSLSGAGVTAVASGGVILISEVSGGTLTVVSGTVSGVSPTESVTLANGGVLSGGTLTNVNNTITGQGTIGDSTFTFINSGIVDAAANNTLSIADSSTVTNSGTLEATSDGLLEIFSDVANSKTIEALGPDAFVDLRGSVTNASSAVILASGSGTDIDLISATIAGGTLKTSAGAVVETDGSSVISGATIASGTLVKVNDGSTLTLAALAGDGGDFFGSGGAIAGNLDTSGTLEAGSGTTSTTATSGTLTISGNYAASGGKLIEAVSGTSGGELSVTGTADLAGGTLDVVVNSSGGALASGSSYEVLSASGGITAPFSAIEYNGITSAGQIIDIGSGGLALEATYSSNEVTLNVVNSGVTDTWITSSGDWTTSADWNSGVPTTADTAVISHGGNVTISGSDGPLTVGNLSIGPAVGLSVASLALVSGGDLTVLDNVTNSGRLSVDSAGRGGSTLDVGGTFTNAGTFAIANTTLSTPTTVTLNGLDNTASRTIDITGNSTNTSNSATLFVSGAGTNAGTILASGLDGDATLELGGSFANSGTIALSGVSVYGAELLIDGTVALSGGGKVSLSDSAGIEALSAATLVNVNNTIAGYGLIGVFGGTLTFANSGTVDANSGGNYLEDFASVTNNFGVLEATSAGWLLLGDVNNSKSIEALGTSAQVYLDGNVTNATSGAILASGSGANVQLESSITIAGGKLETAAGGVIETVDGSSDTISGVTITSGSTFAVESGTSATLEGTIANSGTIALAAGSGVAYLDVDGTVSLTGGGKVSLSNGGGNVIENSGNSAATLINVNNTIAGTGQIRNGIGGSLTFDNDGTVDADVDYDNNPNNILSILSASVANSGTLEATADGYLRLVDSVVANSAKIEALGTSTTVLLYGVTIANTSAGVILASGTSASVYLSGQDTITGGTLETSAGGVIEVHGSNTIGNVTIASGTNVEDNSYDLTLSGTITDNGAITVTGDLAIAAPGVTLQGSGVVTLDSDSSIAAGTSATLTNDVKIVGSGSVGNYLVTLVNEGTIVASGSGAELGVSTSSNTVSNAGTLEASADSILDIGSNVANSDRIEAAGTSATVSINSSTITDTGAGVILASGTDATIQLNSATIVGGTLETSAGGTIETVSGSTNAISGATIAAGAFVEALTSGTLDVSGALANSGTVSADGTNATVSIDSATITDSAAGSILASGSGASVQLDDATILGGKLEASGTSATIEIVSGIANVISGATIAASTVIEVESGATLTLVGGTIDAGAKIETQSGGTLDVSGTVANSGTLYASGSGSLVDIAAGTVVNGGTAEVGNGTVEIDGASSEAVSFLSTGSGGLLLYGTGSSYTGKISGFGPVDGGTSGQYIDFADITSTGLADAIVYTAINSSSGTLTVTDGTHSASVILVGSYTSGDFQAHAGIDSSLEITDPTVTITSALTVASGITTGTSGGDIIAESTVTVAKGGTLKAEDGNNLKIQGTLTNSGTAEALDTSDMNLQNAVSNIGTLAALSQSDITLLGTLTNNGTVEAGDSATDSSAITIESNVTNNNLITAMGYSQLLLDVPGVAAPTLITNNGTIEAQNNSLITLAPGNSTSGTGLANHGIIVATDNATLLVAAATSSFTNYGTLEADSNGLVKVNSFITNPGTIEAGGTGEVLLNGSLEMIGTLASTSQDYSVNNSGVLKVTGTGSIIVANDASGSIAEIDGTGTVNNATGIITGPIDTIAFDGSTTPSFTGGTTASNTNVSFGSGASGLLTLNGPDFVEILNGGVDGSPNGFTGSISGFTQGDAIDLPNIPYTISSTVDTVVFVPNANNDGGVLEVKNGSYLLANLNLAGFDPNGGSPQPYVDSNFLLNQDGGGIIITDPSVTIQKGNAPATIAGGETLDVNKPDSGNVTFAASSGTLVLDDPSTFTGTVAGLTGQDGLDLTGIDYGANTTLAYAPNSAGTGGVLSISDGTHAASVALLGSYIASSFATAPDGHGGTLITDPALTAQNPNLTLPHAA